MSASFLTRRRGGRGWHWTDIVTWAWLAAGVVLMFGPALWLVASSFKGPAQLAEFPPTLLPYVQQTAEVEGHDEPLPLYVVTQPDGSEVVLVDRDRTSAEKGKTHSDTLVTDLVNKGRATAAEGDALLARIVPTADYGALKDCDLVIEAVFEDRKVKAEAIAKAEAVIGQGTVFGSNTSTLPITSLAEASKRPANFSIHSFGA